jgi:hypothetical protein
MNERTAGAALLVIGVVALFAAIVGGGIKIREIEVGSVPSRVRQGLLAAFGLVVGLIGLILVMPDDNTANAADIENIAAADENGADAVDANAAEENTDANVAEDASNASGEARTE